MGCASCILFPTQQDLCCGSIPQWLRIFHCALLCARKLDCHSNGGCNMSNRPSAGTRMLGMAEIALSIKHAERGQWNLTLGRAASSLTPLRYPYPILPPTQILHQQPHNKKVNMYREREGRGKQRVFLKFHQSFTAAAGTQWVNICLVVGEVGGANCIQNIN